MKKSLMKKIVKSAVKSNEMIAAENFEKIIIESLSFEIINDIQIEIFSPANEDFKFYHLNLYTTIRVNDGEKTKDFAIGFEHSTSNYRPARNWEINSGTGHDENEDFISYIEQIIDTKDFDEKTQEIWCINDLAEFYIAERKLEK